MALATYSDLQSAVADWLNRTDLTARIPDFIALAEARLNRDLRTQDQETQATLTTVAGTATVDLPADYLEVRGVVLQTSPLAVLPYITPAALSGTYAAGTSGKPAEYTVVGRKLKLGPTPDAAYDIELTYYGKIASLSDVAPTNWVLDTQPNLYLYGALLEAAPYLQDDARVQVWGSLYDSALGRVQSSDERARWGGAPLTIKVTSW